MKLQYFKKAILNYGKIKLNYFMDFVGLYQRWPSTVVQGSTRELGQSSLASQSLNHSILKQAYFKNIIL